MSLKTIVCAIIAGLAAVCALSQHGFAKPPAASPHDEVAARSGIISGTLLEDGRVPLPGHQVSIEVKRQGEFLLSIPKMTDEKGQYQFKNIFQSPEFSYVISTEYDGMIYRTDDVSLKKGEDLKRLDLIVGAGGKPSMPAEPQMQGEAARGEKTPGKYKLLAVLLSIGAAGLALYQRKRKT